MKKTFLEPEIMFVQINEEDVICTSNVESCGSGANETSISWF